MGRMIYCLYLILVVIAISCELGEIDYEYPDRISKPEKIVESKGCGNIFVYQFLDSMKVLTVGLNGGKLELTKKCQTIDLSEDNPNVSVVMEIAGDSPDSVYFFFCDDAVPINLGKTIQYEAISGKLFYSVSEDDPIKEPIWESAYHVTIKIEDLEIYNHKKNSIIKFDEIVFWNVPVGWMPG